MEKSSWKAILQSLLHPIVRKKTFKKYPSTHSSWVSIQRPEKWISNWSSWWPFQFDRVFPNHDRSMIWKWNWIDETSKIVFICWVVYFYHNTWEPIQIRKNKTICCQISLPVSGPVCSRDVLLISTASRCRLDRLLTASIVRDWLVNAEPRHPLLQLQSVE